EMDAGDHCRVGFCAVGFELDLATGDLVTPAAQDQHHIVSRAAAGPGQHHLHRARGKVVATAFGGAVHGRHMTAAGACHEEHAFRATPVDGALHNLIPVRMKKGKGNDNTSTCFGGASARVWENRMSENQLQGGKMIEHSSNYRHSGFVRRSNPLEDILAEVGKALQVLDGSAQ